MRRRRRSERAQYTKGVHRIEVEEVRAGVDRITFYELMGGRWVRLGEPEDWSRAASMEVIEDYE